MKKECAQIDKQVFKKITVQGGMRYLESIIFSVDLGLSKIQKIFKDREAWSFVVLGVAKSRTQLSD